MDDDLDAVARRQKAFQSLDFILRQHASQEPWEIEILPESHKPPEGQMIIADEYCVGIPKKVLQLAFVEACRVFQDRGHRMTDNLPKMPVSVHKATQRSSLPDHPIIENCQAESFEGRGIGVTRYSTLRSRASYSLQLSQADARLSRCSVRPGKASW